MAITYRSVKGSALTHTELDANFTDLNGRATANAVSAAAAVWPNRVLVTQANAAATLGGTIDSTVEYIITESINMNGIQIVVPATGIYLRGYNFDICGLTSTSAAETLFYSLAAGNVLMLDLFISVSGAGSQVYDLKSNTGFEAVEVARINYNNCTSLGELDNFRQGLESGTGRFGGTPSLILTGTWAGGYYLDTSITRGLTAGSYSLFTAGAAFSMASRFRSNMNVDLPAGVSYCDFNTSAFPNTGTVQMEGMLITRAGVNDPEQGYFPNMSHADAACMWSSNTGLYNTHPGMVNTVVAEFTTPIAVAGTAVRLDDPLWSATFKEHFVGVGTKLDAAKHLGGSPLAFRVHLDVTLESSSGDDLRLELWFYDASAATDAKVWDAVREVNNFSGGRDVCYFTSEIYLNLGLNDYCYFKVANETSTSDITAELGSNYSVAVR